MNIEEVRDYCLKKKGTSESFPFDEYTLVFKVVGKMYALASLKKREDGKHWINLKCEPERAIELRERYKEVTAGYHMSKKHWNTVTLDGTLGKEQICKWIDHSYELVAAKLTRKQKEELTK